MILTISIQIDGKDILKYRFTPTIEFISYEEIEKLQESIEKFIDYTLPSTSQETEDDESL